MLGGIGIATTVEIAEQVGIEVDYKHPRIWGGWTVYSIVPDEIALGGRRPRRARDRHSIPVRRPRRVQIRDPRQRHPPDRAQARKRAPAPAGLAPPGPTGEIWPRLSFFKRPDRPRVASGTVFYRLFTELTVLSLQVVTILTAANGRSPDNGETGDSASL
jgi:hypothetical protein